MTALDDALFGMALGAAVADPSSPVHGRQPEELLEMTDGGAGPVRLLDFLIRTGPYGDGYGADPDGLTLARLEAAPHGIDLGPLEPRFPDDLCTPSGMVELAPTALLAPARKARLDAAPLVWAASPPVGLLSIRGPPEPVA